MEYDTAILTGFCTGVGVIFAQKFVNYLDRHSMIVKLKKTVDGITKNNMIQKGKNIENKGLLYFEDLVRK
jgi:hypothetical protein